MIVAATSGWEIAVAIGTISAAVMTSWLAFSTRNLARAAGDETRANWLPVVVIESAGTVAVGQGFRPMVAIDPEGILSITLANIGRGPAVRVTAYIAADDSDDWETRGAIKRGRASSDVLAPGGRLTLRWAKDATPDTSKLNSFTMASRAGTITFWDITRTRHETFVELGFKRDGSVELVNETYVGAKRMPGKRQRVGIRLRWWKARALRRWHQLRPKREPA